MSPRLFRRFLKPRMARMIDLVHSYGVKAFHHDDGAMRPLAPAIIGALALSGSLVLILDIWITVEGFRVLLSARPPATPRIAAPAE